METVNASPNLNPTPPTKNNWLIPLSIIIAGLLIAGGVFAALLITRGTTPQNTEASKRTANPHLEKNLKPVTAADHITGSPSAPITIVEYSDTDCYYCNQFRPTLEKIISDYGPTGKVAWVYRHFNTGIPAHPHTLIEAQATECVAELGGNDKFWEYIHLLFTKKNFNVQPAKLIDPSQLPTIAASIGINKTQFSSCLTSGKYIDKVGQNTADIKAAGGNGTPYSFIISKAAISKEANALVSAVNDQYVSQSPGAADVLFTSKDNHIIVVTGALPADLINQIIALLVKANG
jgi:protein-disulfide isomerase